MWGRFATCLGKRQVTNLPHGFVPLHLPQFLRPPRRRLDRVHREGSRRVDSPLVEQSGNRNGYILELSEEGDDAAKTGFFWNLFLVCGDPAAQETYFGGFDKTKVSPISCPDNLAFDSHGNLWISTDGNVLGSNDGIFTVPVAGPNRGQVTPQPRLPRRCARGRSASTSRGGTA